MPLVLSCTDCHAVVLATEASEHSTGCPAQAGAASTQLPPDALPAEIVRLRSEAQRLSATAAEFLQTAAELESRLNPGPPPTVIGTSALALEMRHASRHLCRSVERHNVTVGGVSYSIRKVIKDDYHVIKVTVASGHEADYQWNDSGNIWEQISREPIEPKAAAPGTSSDWRGLKSRLQAALGAKP